MLNNNWHRKEMPLVSLIGMGGGIASPAFLASIVLNILKPTVFSPLDDTGVPDFVYEAASSAIANVDQVTSDVPSVGSPEVFESATTNYISATYDSTNNKVVVAYQDYGNSGYGTAVVGTVSGTGISFGTPVVFNSAGSYFISTTYDSTANKVVIAYMDNGNSNYGTAILGTVSGNSISFGSPVVFEYAQTKEISAIYDPTNNKVVIGYSDFGNTQKGTAIVGTISGTSISFGSPVVFQPSLTNAISSAYDPNNNKVVFAYNDQNNSYYGKSVVGTVSGTSISFGSVVTFESAHSNSFSVVYDTANQKVVIAYRDFDNSNYGTAIVGTVSGTSINFGSPVVFRSANSQLISAIYDSTNNNIVISYGDGGNSDYGAAIVGTVSGTSITFGSPFVFNSSNSWYMNSVYDITNNKVVIAYQDKVNSDYGTAVVFSQTTEATQLTLTDTTVSKVSDGTLIEGTTIDEVLTVGETVQADTAVASTVTAPVFSTTLYTGNFPNTGGGETQKITTGIDNTGKALIWQKCRTQNGSYAFNHQLTNTLRGAGKTLITNNSWEEKNERAATEFF